MIEPGIIDGGGNQEAFEHILSEALLSLRVKPHDPNYFLGLPENAEDSLENAIATLGEKVLQDDEEDGAHDDVVAENTQAIAGSK